MLVLATVALFVLALPATGSADLPSYVVPPVLGSTTTCDKRACQFEVACPVNGGGDLLPSGQRGGVGCEFQASLFVKKPSLGLLTPGIVGLTPPGVDLDPRVEIDVLAGERKRVSLPVTPIGQKDIKTALHDGRRKLKGVWEMAVIWYEASETHPGSGEFIVERRYEYAPDQPVQVKLKGKGGKK
ncbi:MAG: hypothetical protein ACXWW8_01770 [Solirubrobacterales bacterium]